MTFFNEKSGTQRVVGGGFLDVAGRIEALDTLAQEFLQASTPEARKDVAARTDAAIAALPQPDEYAKFYALAIKAIEGGRADFAQKEVDRLTRMLGGGKVTAKARANLSKRVNIAKQFIKQE